MEKLIGFREKFHQSNSAKEIRFSVLIIVVVGEKNRACVTRIKAHIHFNRCDPKSFSNDFNACARFDVGVSSVFDFIYLTSTEVFEVLDGKVLCEYPKNQPINSLETKKVQEEKSPCFV